MSDHVARDGFVPERDLIVRASQARTSRGGAHDHAASVETSGT
jgi:hypothetical protein